MFGRKKQQKYVIGLTTAEYRLLIDVLVAFRNALIAAGQYTDTVDELLFKICR